MQRFVPGLLALSLVLAVALPAGARVRAASEARLRTVCLERGSARHPRAETLSIAIPDSRFADAGGTAIALLYEPEPANTGARGRVDATVTRIAPDGTRTELAGLQGRQTEASHPLELAEAVDSPIESGDVVAFDVELKGFDKLRGDECFSLIALLTPLE